MSVYIEAFNGADDSPTKGDDGLLWKEILREGVINRSPTNRGVVNKPFTVLRDGASSQKDMTVSMSDLIASHDAKAYEHVQVPLSDDDSHEDGTGVNTGFVRKLRISDGPDGKARLMAGLDLTEPDVKGKVERGTIANCSAGLWFNRERPDGTKFPAALRHVLLTNKPFMAGLKPFGGVGFSEGEDEDQVEESYGFASGDTVWAVNESLNRLRENVETALNAITVRPSDEATVGDPVDYRFYYARDFSTNKALVEENTKDGETTYVIPFKRKKNAVELAPSEDWIRAEQEWITASEETDLSKAGREALATFLSELPEPQAPEETETPEPETVIAASEPEKTYDDTPRGRLAEAQAARARRITNKPTRGGASMSKIDLTALTLSDEDRSALAAVLSENESLKEAAKDSAKRERESAVDAEIERVKGLGLSEHPGFLKKYRQLLKADDGQPAGVVFSEETGEQPVTLSEAVKSLVDALPQKDGKIVLSEQALRETAGPKSPEHTPEENEETETHEDAVKSTRAILGI